MSAVVVDLNLARNMRGVLNGELRARLMAAVNQPGQPTWDDAYSIILNFDGAGLTLWQAVCELDPSYMTAGPVTTEDGQRGEWQKTPPPETIIQAINYATR